MTASVLPGLVVDVEARIDKLEKALARANVAQRRASDDMEKRAKQSADRLTATYGRAGDALKRLTLPLVGGLLSGGAVLAGLKATVARLDEIGKTADKIGVTTDALQELRAVAESAGISQDKLDQSLQVLSKNLGEAALGMGEGRIALKALGLEADKLKALGLDGALSVIADALNRIKDPAQRSALAMKLFGESGAGMVNLLREGSAGMERMRADARALGVVVEESLIRNAEEAQTKLDMMSRVISAQLSTALVNLAPILIDAANGVISVTQAVREFLALDFSLPELKNADQLREYASQYKGLESELSAVTQAQTAFDANVEKYGENSQQAESWARRLASAQEALTSALKERKDAEAAEGRAVAGIKAIASDTAAAKEKARLADMGAEAAERERISKEKSAKAEQILADIQAAKGTVTETERAQVAQIADNWERAQIAASAILNPVKPKGGGGGGSHKSSRPMDDFATSLKVVQDHIAKAGALSATFDSELQKLDARFRSGEISGGQYAAALDQLGRKFNDVEVAAQTIEGTFESAFSGLVTGAHSFGDALRMIVSQLADMAASRVFDMIWNGGSTGGTGIGGGIINFLGGLFGFADGGFTGRGSKYQPAGIVHRGEYVFPREVVRRVGVDSLAGLHSAALRGYADGGYVGTLPRLSAPSGGSGRAAGGAPTVTIHNEITVQGSAGTPEQNADLADKVARELEGSMRGVVVDELRKQMRPGNMIGNMRHGG